MCDFPIKYFNMMYFWQFKVERWVCKKLEYREFDVLSPYQAPGLAVYEDDSLKDDKPGAGTVLRAIAILMTVLL